MRLWKNKIHISKNYLVKIKYKEKGIRPGLPKIYNPHKLHNAEIRSIKHI